jgi:BirA family transcriptional regulator, biotin operon repressor / biotin---[acetyl-CoA-carboxylase] ligase
VQVLQEAPSTNTAVAERAMAGAEEGLVVVAEHQTSGRGRLGRDWVVPPRAALTFSFLLAPDRVPASRWPWLPLLSGIAVAEAVRRVAEVDCSLKWPNDVLAAEQKLAGILVERLDRPGGAVAVVGIGLNVSAAAEELPVPSATSLRLQAAGTLDRSVLLREVLRSFEALYAQWQADAGDPSSGLLDSYRRRCSTLGRQVTVDLPTGARLEGTATGVDVEGRLQVLTSAGLRVLGAGDVRHVRAAGGVVR